MFFHKWTRIFILAPLLLSLIRSTPAQAQTSTPKLLWCPATVTAPTPKQAGCTPAFTSMTALWTHLTTHMPAQAGTIWIGVGYNSVTAGDGNLGFDGTVLTKMAKYPLSFKGGWKGPGTSALNVQAPATLQGHTFAVANWKGKVTIKNFKVVLNAASTATLCDNAAVCVKTAGGILLDRVHEEGDNTSTVDYGAILDNTASLTSPPGAVVVTSSMFLNNNNSGMGILTKGAVTLKNMITSDNASYGTEINNAFDTTAFPVTVTNGQFNLNAGDGLNILSNGLVNLTNLLAEGNGSGIFVDNTAGVGDVTLKGTNTVLGNDFYGMGIVSHGSVNATRLVAYENGTTGVYIDNSTAPSAKGVALTVGGTFIRNSSNGLAVFSKGSVSTTGAIAASNGAGIEVQAIGGITLSCSGASDNGIGLYIRPLNVSDPLKLTLKGFLSYGNTTNENIVADPIVRTACPTG